MTHPKPLLTAMYFTDTHSKGVNPRSRIDDYPLAIIEKVDWVVQQSIKRKVDIILHGGDWFDSHDVGNSVVGDFMDAIAPAVAAGIPIVGTYGSHDVHGYNAETLKRGALRILESSKMVTILRRGQVYAINGVAIVGCPHTTGLDGGDGNYFIDDYYCVDQIAQEEYDATILLAHGTLVEYPLPDGFDHTLIENVKVNADLVLSGDYHEGYGVYRRSDGVVFCNPGSVARTKVTNKRIPCVAFVEVYAAGFDVDHGVSIIPIAKAKPVSEIFNEAVKDDEPSEHEVTAMVQYLQKETSKVGETFDPIQAIEEVPVVGDKSIIREARDLAVGEVQKADKEKNG